tara:strand:+ start:125 stop:391 length:267 start_codon:yes stop_codon:yes gene_type:complete
MQKIINVLAIASSVVSLTVVGVGGYVYLNKDAIIEGVTQKALGSLGGFGGALGGGSLGGGALQDSLPDMAAPMEPMQEVDPTKSVPAF